MNVKWTFKLRRIWQDLYTAMIKNQEIAMHSLFLSKEHIFAALIH